jgi:hypothetical protein
VRFIPLCVCVCVCVCVNNDEQQHGGGRTLEEVQWPHLLRSEYTICQPGKLASLYNGLA